MTKKIFALFLLLVLLGPMFWGIWRIRKLPREKRDLQIVGDDDDDDTQPKV